MIIAKKDCYRDFLDRLYKDTDKCMILVREGRNIVEVAWRKDLGSYFYG